MVNFILSFLIGSIVTYLATIISSTIRSSEILEDAMLSYALLMMSAYEISLKQMEQAIIREKLEGRQAENLRKIHNNEFDLFANKKIKEVLKRIPPAHENILRYKNFSQMKIYITQQYRSKYEKSK